MRHSIRLVAGILLVAATLAGCDGGGGGQSTVSSGGAPPPTTPSPPGAGGDGGSCGSGGGSASLNTTRFRTLTVSVTPPNGGTVSDNFEDHGSAIQQCTACSERYQIGTRVVLTARAAPGFRFDRWQGPVCEGSASPTCALVMEQATGMTAVFRR
jgi:Divergent InlB B-repeat domain